MKKSIVICAFLFPFTSFSQVDLSIDSVFHRMGVGGVIPQGMDYYTFSNFYVDSTEFSGLVSNNGVNAATNVYLKVDFVNNNNVLETHFSDTANICAGCTDSLVFTPFMIPLIDNTTIKCIVFSDSVDTNPTNDVDSLFYNVSSSYDNPISRDNKFITEHIINIPGNDSLPFSIGNVFEILGDGRMNGIQCVLSNDSNNIGGIIYGSIYLKEIGDSIWDYTHFTNDYTVVPGDLGNAIDLYFDPPLCMDSQLYDIMLVMIGHYGSGIEVEFELAQKVDPETVKVQTQNGIENFVGEKAAMVRPLLYQYACGIGLEDIKTETLTFQISPNPSNQNTNIQYQLQSNAVVELTLSDLSGRQIRKEHLGNQISGSHTYQLDVTDLQSGVYLLTLQAGDQQKSQKLIISK